MYSQANSIGLWKGQTIWERTIQQKRASECKMTSISDQEAKRLFHRKGVSRLKELELRIRDQGMLLYVVSFKVEVFKETVLDMAPVWGWSQCSVDEMGKFRLPKLEQVNWTKFVLFSVEIQKVQLVITGRRMEIWRVRIWLPFKARRSIHITYLLLWKRVVHPVKPFPEYRKKFFTLAVISELQSSGKIQSFL